MKKLSEVVIYMMELLVTANEPGLDYQACGDITNDVWFQLAEASPAERQAMADAAVARLRELLREPDEYGYTPRGLVAPLQQELLQSLADGSAWHEFDRRKAGDF